MSSDISIDSSSCEQKLRYFHLLINPTLSVDYNMISICCINKAVENNFIALFLSHSTLIWIALFVGNKINGK